ERAGDRAAGQAHPAPADALEGSGGVPHLHQTRLGSDLEGVHERVEVVEHDRLRARQQPRQPHEVAEGPAGAQAGLEDADRLGRGILPTQLVAQEGEVPREVLAGIGQEHHAPRAHADEPACDRVLDDVAGESPLLQEGAAAEDAAKAVHASFREWTDPRFYRPGSCGSAGSGSSAPALHPRTSDDRVAQTTSRNQLNPLSTALSTTASASSAMRVSGGEV